MAAITKEKRYEVRNAKVFLSLVVGEGQFGRSDVFVGAQKVIRTSGSFDELLLGEGQDLIGKDVVIRTLAVDVNAQSNRMHLTYQITGGPSSLEFESKGEVTNQGGTLTFKTTITLF